MAASSANCCLNCGAALPATMTPQMMRCAFCGREQLVTPPWTGPGAMPPPMPMQASRGVPGALIALLVLLPVLGLVVFGVYVWEKGRYGSTTKTWTLTTSTTTSWSYSTPPTLSPATSTRIQWRGPAVPVAAIDGDAVEDFVGVYMVLDFTSGTQTQYAGAFSGATFEPIWSSAPLGTLVEGATATHVGVAGAFVVVTDYKYQAHILDLRTGRELNVVTLTDRAQDVCSPVDTRNEVWIEVADHRSVTIDLSSGKVTAATKRPAFCPAHPDDVFSFGCRNIRAPCYDADGAPAASGFHASFVLRDGKSAVAIGEKSPGTPIPIAMGFDPVTKVETWRQVIPNDPTRAQAFPFEAADFARGRLVAAYALSSLTWRVAAFDAVTGARSWDVPLGGGMGSGAEAITLGKERAYIVNWLELEVLDVRTGATLGTVGGLP